MNDAWHRPHNANAPDGQAPQHPDAEFLNEIGEGTSLHRPPGLHLDGPGRSEQDHQVLVARLIQRGEALRREIGLPGFAPTPAGEQTCSETPRTPVTAADATGRVPGTVPSPVADTGRASPSPAPAPLRVPQPRRQQRQRVAAPVAQRDPRHVMVRGLFTELLERVGALAIVTAVIALGGFFVVAYVAAAGATTALPVLLGVGSVAVRLYRRAARDPGGGE